MKGKKKASDKTESWKESFLYSMYPLTTEKNG